MSLRPFKLSRHTKLKVSIVIPCYNLGEYIDEAIESIREQTFRDYEILVIDDGSTDIKTKKVLQRLKQEKDINIHTIKNSKLPAARNYGINKANGKYIVCLDADDKLAPNYLKKTAAVLDGDKEKKIGFVTTWVQEFGARNSIWETSDFDIPKLLIKNVVEVASMFRKDAWRKVGGYNETLTKEGNPLLYGYEDWDFWLRIVEAGYRWARIPEPLFLYRIREGSMLSTSRNIHAELYANILKLHKNLLTQYSEEVTLKATAEINCLEKLISKKDITLAEEAHYRAEYHSQVQELTKKTAYLENDLASLKNSRIVAPAIKTRSILHSVIRKVKRI